MTPRTFSIKCKDIVLGIVLCFVFAQAAHSQTVIFQENFDGTGDLGTSLNESWITAFDRANGGSDAGAVSIFGADGSVDKVGGGTSATNDAGALLALPGGSLLANSIYTLSATVDNNNTNWTAFGFASSDATLDGVNGRHSNGSATTFGGYAWGLFRNSAGGNDQEIFGGAGTGSNFLGGDIVSPIGPIDFDIVLDTSDTAALTAEYFFNGTSQGIQTLGANAFTDIAFVGISSDGGSAADNSNASTISNFTLTVSAVPEPSSLSLLALGGLAMLSRRRLR